MSAIPTLGIQSPADFLRFTQGWLVHGLNNAVTVNAVSATTDDYEFRDGGTAGTIRFTLRLIYTDATKATLLSAERTV